MAESRPISIDWRSLFSELGVSWKDRGSNCVRGNVNIPCPACGNDPSYHLGVSEEIEAYYCYRDSRHAGRSFVRLLWLLGQSRTEALALLNRHQGRVSVKPVEAPREQQATNKLWANFLPASQSPQAVAYLDARGFTNSAHVINRYDLRYTPQGKWSRRVLLPFLEGGEVLTWSGRTWEKARSPKYLTDEQKIAGLVYTPRLPRGIVVICEGPLDALKISVATEDEDISAIALTGKGLNASKLLRLARLTRGKRVIFCPDDDVSVGEAYNLLSQLRASLDATFMNVLRLPSGFKDPGEMALSDIAPWIKGGLLGHAVTHRGSPAHHPQADTALPPRMAGNVRHR